MPATALLLPDPDEPVDPSDLSGGVRLLAAMGPSQRNAILLLLDVLHSLPKQDLAIVAKTIQPHLTDAEVATLCGVSSRTLYNWDRYQSWKPRLADYLEAKQQGWYMPPEDLTS